MSYDENELAGELNFKIDDDEPMDLPEDGDDFKFDEGEEEQEEDPEDKFH